MRYDTILFDLDGTLVDPKVGITRCMQLALTRSGIDVADPETLTPYIGRHHGLDADASRLYRERFAEIGWLENEVYPGIPELLATLHERGARLVVATSKPTVFAEQIVTHFGLAPWIDLVAGSNLDNSRVAEAAVIAHVLAERPEIAPARAVMVGDREHDAIGARANGIPAIGVAYGYGQPGELAGAGFTAIAESVAELGRLLLH